MRWIGAALIFLSFSLGGIVISEKEKRRLMECEAFLSFFVYIQNQVSFFFAPTKSIFRGFQNEVLEEIGFLPALREDSDELFWNRFCNAFLAIRERTALSGAECRIIMGFGSCIGKNNAELQLRQLSYWTKEMEEELRKQRERYRKNGQLARTVGFSLGAMIALLLL